MIQVHSLFYNWIFTVALKQLDECTDGRMDLNEQPQEIAIFSWRKKTTQKHKLGFQSYI